MVTKPHHLPVDTGYSWVVCIACVVAFFFVLGVQKCCGIILIEFQEFFQSDPSITTLTVSLILAGFFMFVFAANTIGLMVGMRNCALGAAVISFLSMFLTSFAPNIYFVVIILGVFSGVGYSGMFGPGLIILTPYFERHRALTTGIAMAGASIGQLVLPFVFVKFISFYAFRGGIMLFSALLLHLIPAALIMRPPSFWMSRQQKIAMKDAPKATCSRALRQMLGKELLVRPLFYHYILCLTFAHCGYFCSMVFLPRLALDVFGDKTMCVLLVSVCGAADFIGRMLGGWVSDLKIIPINMVMSISMGIPGVVAIITAIYPADWLVWITGICVGCFAGAYAGLITPSIVEFFGMPRVPQAFGVVAFIMGLFIIPLPAGLAKLGAMTSMREVILVCGILMSVACVSFALMSITVKAEVKKHKKAELAKANGKEPHQKNGDSSEESEPSETEMEEKVGMLSTPSIHSGKDVEIGVNCDGTTAPFLENNNTSNGNSASDATA